MTAMKEPGFDCPVFLIKPHKIRLLRLPDFIKKNTYIWPMPVK